MRENRMRQIWAAGGAVVNGWLAIPSAFSAETMAHQGWDSLTIDMQHGVTDYQTAVAMLTAIATTDTVPLVRVPWLDPGIIMKSLDAAAYGVICPMVNTGDDAELLVSSCRYPPQGSRSFGPIRALLFTTPNNPLGLKGIGESGAIGSTPAVQSAVVDALSPMGIRHIDLPLSPERVWQAIQEASA